jgi:two-component system response regulator YesN
MIKLLISDDEIFTINGIIESINWKELGVDLFGQATNGLKAYDMACEMKPDIILTDIRMPRMDGIEFAVKYRQIAPDCRIIFMSGYSDKEYLKSAIKLNAIDYIEKPIVISELVEALKNAVSQCVKKEKSSINETSMIQKLSASIPLIQSELAIQLTYHNVNESTLSELINFTNFDFNDKTVFTTLLIKTISESETNSNTMRFLTQSILSTVSTLLEKEESLKGIGAVKDDTHVVLHLYNTSKNNLATHKENIYGFCLKLHEVLSSKKPVSIAAGVSVTGIKRIYDSYDCAVLALQSTFFHCHIPVIFYKENPCIPYEFDESFMEQFHDSLLKMEKEKAFKIIKSVSMDLRKQDNTLVKYVKDIYFRFLMQLVTSADENNMSIFDTENRVEYLWDIVSRFNTLEETENYLLERLTTYFNMLDEVNSNSSLLLSIKKYIHTNYANEDLSVVGISKFIYMTPSYICRIFKSETGKTINQYITEFRIEKSKELLKDHNLKVSDIASKLGYNDGTYFAKLFKKTLGVTPSEYRERFLL